MKILPSVRLKGEVQPFDVICSLIEYAIGRVCPRIQRFQFSGTAMFTEANFDFISKQNDEYLTVAQMAQRYPAFSQGSLRWMIFNANINGFNKVVRRIGRKVVLNLSEFKRFLEDQAV